MLAWISLSIESWLKTPRKLGLSVPHSGLLNGLWCMPDITQFATRDWRVSAVAARGINKPKQASAAETRNTFALARDIIFILIGVMGLNTQCVT